MPKFDVFNPLFDVIKLFTDRCIKSDNSLLWPNEQVWTINNLEELNERFIGHPIEDPNISFEEKLRRQIGEEKSVLWALIADLYFIYFLTSRNILTETKIKQIKQFAEYVPFDFPSRDDPIWSILEIGLCRTVVFYHKKYRQFSLMILFFLKVKNQENPESVIKNSESFKKIIDPIVEETGAYDMRCALLYLFFPEKYDPIISKDHKRQIIEAFAPKIQEDLPSDLDEDLPSDLDEAILTIRKYLQKSRLDLPKPFHFYDEPIRSEWEDVVKPPPNGSGNQDSWPIGSTTELMGRINSAINFNKNIILYGPPGSGKTYVAGQFAQKFVEGQLGEKPKELIYQQIIDDLTLHQVISLAIYINDPNGKFSVPEIREMDLLKARFQLNPIKNPKASIWATLMLHGNPESPFIHYARRNDPILFDRLEEPRWYLMDEGKEYVESTLQEYLEMIRAQPQISQASDYITQITFHQSFSYEEFVEGIRPSADEENTDQTTIQVVPGVFRELCARASARPDKQFVLIIDEINRGNVSRIFGELITTIENDKRAGSSNQISVELPYSKEQFSVPQNLIIIGTMNTADRSIALLDTALRRRFAFIEVPVDPELLGDTEVSDDTKSIRLRDLLELLNHKISQFLDRDHQIGHSYFLQVAALPEGERLSAFEYVWNYQIIPLLEEYFYSHPDQLREILPEFVDEVGDMEITRSMHLARFKSDELLITLNEFIENQTVSL